MGIAESNLEWLLPDSQELNSWAADSGLPASFRVVSRIGSTQDFFRAQPAELAAGQTLIADFQSSGHGRLERSWVAPAGSSLLMSTVVSAAAPLPQLPLLVGLAAVDVLQPVLASVALKWPNDIVVPVLQTEPFKLGGIVIALQNGFAIIGIGLNLHIRIEDRPTPLARSLADFVDEPPARNRIAFDLVTALHQRLEATADWATDYRRVCSTIGQPVVAALPGQPPLAGTAVDIDGAGGLVLATATGNQTLRAADVLHVRGN